MKGMNYTADMWRAGLRNGTTFAFFVALFAGVLLWGSGDGGILKVEGAATHTLTVTGIEKQETAYEMLARVNDARSDGDVKTLKWDKDLESAAVIRAREAAIYFSHTRPNGSPWYMVNEGEMHGENLYVGYQAGSSTADKAWMNSSGHRANRLNADYRSYGAAAFQSTDGYVYWVEVFSRNTSSSTTARKENVTRSAASVKVETSYLDLSSGMVKSDGTQVSDTGLRGGYSYFLSIKNWNKQFPYSYVQVSQGIFSTSNGAVASMDTVSGKLFAIKGGIVTVRGQPWADSSLAFKRTLVIRPRKVTGLTLTAKTEAIQLSWNSTSGAVGYEVYRATSQEGTYVRVATLGCKTLTYTNSGLTKGKKYYYKVRGYITKSGSSTRFTGYYSDPKSAIAN